MTAHDAADQNYGTIVADRPCNTILEHAVDEPGELYYCAFVGIIK
jgi:hypothetical protein